MGNKLFILLLSLAFVSHVWSQSSDRNYIQHRVYTDESGSSCQTEVSYYDDKGNVIQTQSTNHLGGIETISHNYSFTDKVTSTYHKHTEEGRNPIEEETIFTYDKHTDKLQAIDHRIGEYDLKRLVDFTYDDNGLLASKNIAGIERLNYSYNLRQWLQKISGEYLNETLCYNTDVDGTTPRHPLYSGNISAQSWHMNYDSKYRTYDYDYDNLWQLTSASYTVRENSQEYEGGYDTSYSYDSMGNILHLTRNSAYDYDGGGFEFNDDVAFCYHGNQLVKSDNAASDAYGLGNFHVSDNVNVETEYFYDANGNMTKDLNKGIEEITYNVLNLPNRITFTNGESIDYLYNSAGILLQKKYYTSLSNIANPENLATPLNIERTLKEQKEYCGNITYDGNWYNVLFDGGMAYFYPDSIPYYQFQIHDHQGNVRASLYWNGGIEQISHYYPFGGLMRESYYDGQPYRYNGKELERMYGLDWYDYGARMYDGLRFTTPDRYMEKYPQVSPYAYCANNPLNAIDVNGDSLKIMNSEIIALLYNGLPDGLNVSFKFENSVLEPNSFAAQMNSTNDFFLSLLYEVAINKKMVEVYASNEIFYNTPNGEHRNIPFLTPNDADDFDFPTSCAALKAQGLPVGRHIDGNLGQSLFPISTLASGKMSINGNINVILNKKGTKNQQTVGLAHELSHVILYLRNLPFGHMQPGVDEFVYGNATKMSKRLGYDY